LIDGLLGASINTDFFFGLNLESYRGCTVFPHRFFFFSESYDYREQKYQPLVAICLFMSWRRREAMSILKHSQFDFYKNLAHWQANHLSKGKRTPWKIEIENGEQLYHMERLDHCRQIYADSSDSIADAFD